MSKESVSRVTKASKGRREEYTYHSALKVLYPPLAHSVHQPPSPSGCILPEVANSQIGVVTDPSFLQVIGCAHQGEPDTAVGWHLVGLITAVLYGLEGRESEERLELDFCLWERKGQALCNTHTPPSFSTAHK